MAPTRPIIAIVSFINDSLLKPLPPIISKKVFSIITQPELEKTGYYHSCLAPQLEFFL